MKVTCVDVTAGGLAVSCDTDGHLLVWTTDNGEVRVCHCHSVISSVVKTGFFPKRVTGCRTGFLPVIDSVRPSTPFSTDTDTPIFCCQPIPIRYRYASRAAVAQRD